MVSLIDLNKPWVYTFTAKWQLWRITMYGETEQIARQRLMQDLEDMLNQLYEAEKEKFKSKLPPGESGLELGGNIGRIDPKA